MPLADRVAHMWFLRLALVALAVVLRAVVPRTTAGGAGTLAGGTAAYLGVSLSLQWAWRALHRRHRGLVLFGAMLLVDGVYLTWASYLTGGASSPLRYLFVLHLVGVVLIGSYRTGLKVVAWDSLLLFAALRLQEAHVIARVGSSSGAEQQQLTAFVAVCWLVTLVAAAFSSVNERELRRRRGDIEALARMATDLELLDDPNAIACAALDRIAGTFAFDRAILIAGRAEGDLAVMAAHGLDGLDGLNGLKGTRCRPGAGAGTVALRAMAAHRTLLESGIDPEADPWLSAALPGGANLIVTPLSADGSPFGALVLEHGLRRGSRVDQQAVAMVERFASYTALALRNAWLLEQVTRSAATDGLTGIANRRTFDVAISRELARAGRASEPVSLLMLDVDHFKKLNDIHGHQTGDELLRQVARILAGHSREFDTTARYGGEEFAVILPSCGPTESVEIAERLRRLIGEADSAVAVTVSVGVATFPGDAPDAVTLIGAADMALYESKRAGRNRVTAASTPPGGVSAPAAEHAAPPGNASPAVSAGAADWLPTPIT